MCIRVMLLWGLGSLAFVALADADEVAIQAGLSPDLAAQTMTVPGGFRVQLAAAEPTIHQPVAFAIDDRGRLWVAEAYTYPQRAAEGEGRDNIVILDDRDDDGVFENRTVFARGLNLVSGLEIGFGGVWVGAAPYLMFIPDANGDDRPDTEPVVLLDGFGYQDTHETLNAFIWGPDGWLYGCHGVFTHSLVGKPGTPDTERIPVNAAVWRYHPTRHEFDVFSRGTSNPWGVDFNDHGHAFITACVIPHLWHVIQGARYQRQGGRHFNPHIYDDIKTIARHRHYVGNIRDHAWWGHEPDPPQDTLAAGGGHAHCGAMIYLGDNWPDVYRNQIFMNNVHGNRVNQDRLFREGSGYADDRATDLLLANDKWFRGINLKYGPDGSVYLIDWYDRNACHRTTSEIWDRTNGRIYNIAFGDPPTSTAHLSTLTDDQLVDLQGSTNDWYVRTARRILQERHGGALKQSASATFHERLWQFVNEGSDVPRRLRAIWALHVTNGLSDDRIDTLLVDTDEYVRSWAIQLALEDRSITDDQRRQFQTLAIEGGSPLVRLYLASALQRLPFQVRRELLPFLVAHVEDNQDHNLPLMIWYGLEPLVTDDVNWALSLSAMSRIDVVSDHIFRRATFDADSLNTMVQWLTTVSSKLQERALDQMLIAFDERVDVAKPSVWDGVYATLSVSPKGSIRERATLVALVFGDQSELPRLRDLLKDPQAPLEDRRIALQTLVRGRDAQAATAFQAALRTVELRGLALRALGNIEHRRTPQVVLDLFDELDESERRDAIATLTSRKSYAHDLLDRIATGRVPRTALHAYNIRQLLSFKDDGVRRRLEQIWGEISDPSDDKLARISELKRSCDVQRLADADQRQGRQLFQEHCANCHRLFGVGGEVGPDITGSNRANLDYILHNVVDPNAVVAREYLMTLFELRDGRLVSGLVQRESDSAVTVQTLTEIVVIAKRDIENRTLSRLSMMPEGLLDRLTDEQVRQLVAYLASPTQVPMPTVDDTSK